MYILSLKVLFLSLKFPLYTISPSKSHTYTHTCAWAHVPECLWINLNWRGEITVIAMMMKKHSSPNLTIRQTFWFGWKLVIILSITLCVLALLRVQRFQSQLSSSSSSYILSRRSRIPVELYGNPKIAFLFLTRQNLPLDFLWQTFFEVRNLRNLESWSFCSEFWSI